MAEATTFLDLVDDVLRLLFIDFLDVPSRFVLALSSRQLRAKVFAFAPQTKIIQSLQFIEECARIGHAGLVEYAVKKGTLVDSTVLEIAVRSGQLAVIKWILANRATLNISLGSDRLQMYLQLCYSQGNEEMIAAFEEVAGRISSLELVASAIAGGHLDFALGVLERHELILEDADLIYSAAESGQVALIERVVALRKLVYDAQLLGTVLLGGCRVGSLDVVRFALEKGATPSREMVATSGVVSNPGVFFLLWAVAQPHMIVNKSSLMIASCFTPHIEVFSHLLSIGCEIEDGYWFDAPRRLFGGPKHDPISPADHEAQTKRLEQNKHRLQCILHLVELRPTYRMNDSAICDVGSWVDFDQMKVLFGLAKNAKHDYMMHLRLYLSSQPHADLRVVDYLLDHATKSIRSVCSGIIVESAFVQNNFDVLNRLLAKWGSERFKQFCTGRVVVSIFKAIVGNLTNANDMYAPSLLSGKKRARLNNSLNLIEWIFRNVAFLEWTLDELTPVQNAYFKKRLSRIAHDARKFFL